MSFMKEMCVDIWKESPLMGLAIWIPILMLCLIPFACTMSVIEEKEFQQTLRANGCTVSSIEKTGNRVYCGKACYRDEKKINYSCEMIPNFSRIQ